MKLPEFPTDSEPVRTGYYTLERVRMIAITAFIVGVAVGCLLAFMLSLLFANPT
jgi:tetrahydromethanopterin S-methyltransferase subunit B